MAITNRDLDVSQQKIIKQFASSSTIATSATMLVAMVPAQGVLKNIQLSAFGLSGAPHLEINILKFAGGQTAVSGVGNTLVVTAFGTSGAIGFSLAAAGSSLLQVNAGDLIVLKTGNANTAMGTCVVDVVIGAVADYMAVYGSSS